MAQPEFLTEVYEAIGIMEAALRDVQNVVTAEMAEDGWKRPEWTLITKRAQTLARESRNLSARIKQLRQHWSCFILRRR